MTITQTSTRLVAVAASSVLALGLLFGAIAGPARAAALTSAQVTAIVSLLQSFGADQATINNVQASLNGQATTGTTGGTTTTTTGTSCTTTWSRALQVGSTGADVKALQQFLNQDASTMVAASGVGSAGNETSSFGGLTKAAVMKFQAKYGISAIGLVGPATRAKLNSLCTSTTSTTTTTTTTGTTVSGTATVSAGAQPANSIAPAGAARVPYTTFTVTAGAAAVTVNSVTVMRQGPSVDTDFAGVVLIDSSTGVQLGTARVLDANHSATIGSPVVIPAGTSKTFLVSGNIAATGAGAGDIASFAVTAVNTGSTVNGSFPITGASNTINATLAIGSATIQSSSFDPNTSSSQPIGTTGYRFTGIRVQAGSVEDVTFKSITWYNSGSASGIQNVTTVVNGTSYPAVADATGRYYTTVFPSGIVIPKGQSVDAYIQGDLGANTISNTYAEFDIYRNTDIYLVGNTYGFGITPTDTGTAAYNSSSSHSTIFNNGGANATPWIQGSTVSVTAGTFSTIQNANSVGAQNIAINVPNQPLGGFMTNLTGEAIQVQSLKVHFTTGVAMIPLQNVSLVSSSGQVISGPYNATCNTSQTGGAGTVCTGADTGQTVTFSGATTFPTGSNTYTIKGQIQTQTGLSGITIVANTNPSSSDWSNVTGQTTGNNVSIGVSNFAMNTMTIKTAALTVSNSTTPTSQNVVAGGSNVLLANIQLDASQSGEDVRLSSLPLTIVYSGTSPLSSLSNCQVTNGTTVLNTGSYIFNGTSITDATTTHPTISFNNSLTVPKGTVMTLGFSCSLSSSAHTDTIYTVTAYTTTSAWGTSGVTSGSTVVPTVNSNAGPAMSVTSGATLVASTDSTAPSYAVVAGGSTGLTANVIKLRATNEAVNLQKLGLRLTSGAATDVVQTYIYAGNNIMTTSGAAVTPGTLLGTATFTGTAVTATSTLNQTVQLPNNVDATLVIKADVATIGVSQPGIEGDLVSVDYDSSQGVGNNSGTTIIGTKVSGFTGVSGLRMFHTFPTISQVSLPSTGVVGDGQLIKFMVNANNSGPVGISQFVFNIASTTSVTIGTPALYAYSDTGCSIPANGTSGGVVTLTGFTYSNVAPKATMTLTTPLQVPSGSSLCFLLKTPSVSYTGGANSYNVSATLAGDATQIGVINATTATTTYNFVWSPNATSTSATNGIGSGDWTNGAGIIGLPSIGLTQNRSN